MDEAPDVPTNLVSTLIGLARHAQDDGTGAGPGVETLMRYTRKSRRQVKYDLDKLRELELIKVSKDQSRVAHIRADRRPVVYDLAMGAECNQLHPDDSERGATDCTSTEPRGATQRSTGCNPASNEVQPTAPEENYEKNLEKNNPSSLSARTSVTAAREDGDTRERDESTSSSTQQPLPAPHRMLAKRGVHGDEANRIIAFIEANVPHPIQGDGWWYAADSNGSLDDWIRKARAAFTQPADTPDPSWLCGTCGDTGWITTDTGSTPCGDCTNDGNGKCRNHRGQYAHTCGGCRGDRLAEANRQGRPDWPATQPPNNLPTTHTDTPTRRPASQTRESAQTRKARAAWAIAEQLDSYGSVENQIAALAQLAQGTEHP